MGCRKIKIFQILLIVACSAQLSANTEYEKYLLKQKQSFQSYKESIEKEFEAFKKAYDEGLKEYKSEISQNWPQAQVTTQHTWVEYNKEYTSKKVIDFDKEQISIEVIANNYKQAQKKIKELSSDILQDDIKSAYNNDTLEQKIKKKLGEKLQTPQTNKKIIGDTLSPKQAKNLLKKIRSKPLKKVKHKKKFIYKANVKLPPQSLINKAKEFKPQVLHNANKQKVPAELVYAIMHSESSFNPMARSHIPAYGLMQIVPQTAGVDTYNFLYGKKKLLSSSYLYDAPKNITIGSAYLHILYYRYLRKIKDPKSKMYCTIAAYNTGAGNVAKAFIGNYNINKASKKINKLTPQEVYTHLMRNLPYNETRGYLKKVNDRMSLYHKLIGDAI